MLTFDRCQGTWTKSYHSSYISYALVIGDCTRSFYNLFRHNSVFPSFPKRNLKTMYRVSNCRGSLSEPLWSWRGRLEQSRDGSVSLRDTRPHQTTSMTHHTPVHNTAWYQQSPPASRSMTSTSPNLLKKVEKEILKEAKIEEANLKHIMNDLSHTEKSESQAYTVSSESDTDFRYTTWIRLKTCY